MVYLFNPTVANLEKMNSIFIELTAKNCNQRCKHCYIDFPMVKSVKDFISIDKIRSAISQTEQEPLDYIYLSGAEPMTHPDFNFILRICLKRTNVVIFTNGSFINEKKARFLKKVQDESENEIIFLLSLAHYDEIKNDNVRYRGSYRHVVNAVKSLYKYEFNPIFNILNYYNEPEALLREKFVEIFDKIGFQTEPFNFQIRKFFDKYCEKYDLEFSDNMNFDCMSSRTLTNKGVYSCPFLANDHRGWAGSDFLSYSKKIYLESEYCSVCSKNGKNTFGINFDYN